MNRRLYALPLLVLLGAAANAPAETLLVERVQERTPGADALRGQSKAQIEARFGAPGQKLEPRGGQKRQWPVIHRWVYPAYTVYFERDRVIDVVANSAGPQEIGPKPAIK